MDYSTPPYHRSNPSTVNKPSKTAETTVAAESSPPSHLRKSKARLADRLEITAGNSREPAIVRQRRKCREYPMCVGQSPKKARRARKRSSEVEIREEKDSLLAEEVGKPRKRRNNVRSKKEKVNLVPSVPYSSSSPKAEEENGIDLDRVGQLLGDLVMWKDISKSVLWFGFGSLCFLSSSFTIIDM